LGEQNKTYTNKQAKLLTVTTQSSEPIRSHNQSWEMVQALPTQLHLHHRAPRQHHHLPHHGLHFVSISVLFSINLYAKLAFV